MAEGTFATAINCMDGRTQLPVNEYMKKTCGVDFVDTVTEPGPDGILGDKTNADSMESIRKRVEISVLKHGSRHVAIVAHHDCAGNPVDKAAHLDHLTKAVEVMEGWGFDCEIIPLWVDGEWKVHKMD